MGRGFYGGQGMRLEQGSGIGHHENRPFICGLPRLRSTRSARIVCMPCTLICVLRALASSFRQEEQLQTFSMDADGMMLNPQI
jgi:hypothetical protein